MADVIYKRAEGVFDVIRNSEVVISASRFTGTRFGDYMNFKSENGAKLVNEVYYYNVQFIDETEGGGTQTFASALAMHITLKQVGFFDSSVGSGSGGVDTFKELLDGIPTFVGLDGKFLVIDSAQNKIVAVDNPLGDISFTDLTDVLSDALTPDMVGQVPIVQMVSISGNTVPMLVFQQLPAIENIPPDGFIQFGDNPTIDENTLTIPEGYIWRISGLQYGNLEQELNIEDAAVGESRIDIIVTGQDDLNSFQVVQGTPSAGEGSAVAPIKPIGTLYLTEVSIYQDNIQYTPELPNLGGLYIEKQEKANDFISGDGNIGVYEIPGVESALVLGGTISRIEGFNISEEFLEYKGKKISIENQSNVDINLDHLGGGNVPMKFPNNETFVLQKNYIVEFLLKGGQFCYVGTMGGSSGDFIPLAEKGQPNGVAPLNSSGTIASVYLPSYVDDVLEYANLASFPVTGETGKIYIADDTNKQYRWSGSAYIQITNGLIASTTDVPEGTRLYFTTARVLATVLAGLNVALTGDVTATDTILQAFGRVQNRLTSLATSLTTLLGRIQNSLAIDGTGSKIPTVDAIINGGFNRLLLPVDLVQTSLTGIQNQTILKSWTIPANTIPDNCILNFSWGINRSGTGSGAVSLGVGDNTGTGNRFINLIPFAIGTGIIPRSVRVRNGVFSCLNSSGGFPTDRGVLGLPNANLSPIDRTQDIILSAKISSTDTTSVVTHDFLSIEILK